MLLASRQADIPASSSHDSVQAIEYAPYLPQLSVEGGVRRLIEEVHVAREEQVIFAFLRGPERDVQIARKLDFRSLSATFRNVGRNRRNRTFELIPAMCRHDSTQLHNGSMHVECEGMRLLPGD